MKRLPILVVLSSVVLLCSTAPALESVTCDDDSGTAAARLAMHHINEHHEHGYKFRLSAIKANKVETVGEGCNVELDLDLLETTCHTVNPKHFEDCEIREEVEQAVMANCTVTITVTAGDAEVTKYECDTRRVKTNSEMVAICPDCPILIPLSDPEGFKSVNEALKKFNQNITNQHYYILQEVGRIRSGYMMMVGMNYYAEFALVETRCPMGSRIVLEACKPLCPDRAHHAFCQSSYSEKEGLDSVECEYYPPSNTTALGPGEQEPICRPSHPVHLSPHDGVGGAPPHTQGLGHGPPIHAGVGGPPPHAHGHGHGRGRGHGPPPHAGVGGPPPHAHGHGPPPFAANGGPSPGQRRVYHLQPFHFCHLSQANSDQAIHPICAWPRDNSNLNPKVAQS